MLSRILKANAKNAQFDELRLGMLPSPPLVCHLGDPQHVVHSTGLLFYNMCPQMSQGCKSETVACFVIRNQRSAHHKKLTGCLMLPKKKSYLYEVIWLHFFNGKLEAKTAVLDASISAQKDGVPMVKMCHVSNATPISFQSTIGAPRRYLVSPVHVIPQLYT